VSGGDREKSMSTSPSRGDGGPEKGATFLRFDDHIGRRGLANRQPFGIAAGRHGQVSWNTS
jgi:hypothetical protein